MGREERVNRELNGDKRKVASPRQRAREFWLSGYTRMMLCEEITRLQDKCGEMNPPEVRNGFKNDFSMESTLPDEAEDIVPGPLDSEIGKVEVIEKVTEGEGS